MFDEQTPEEIRLIEQTETINQEIKEIAIEKSDCNYQLKGVWRNKKYDVIEVIFSAIAAVFFLSVFGASLLFSWGYIEMALAISFGAGGTPIWAAVFLVVYLISQTRYWLKNSDRELFRTLAAKLAIHNRAAEARLITEKLEQLTARENELRKNRMVIEELKEQLFEIKIQKEQEQRKQNDLLQQELEALVLPEQRLGKALTPGKQYRIQNRDEYFHTSKSVDDELSELQKSVNRKDNTKGINAGSDKKELLPDDYSLPQIKSTGGGTSANPLFYEDPAYPKTEEPKLRKNDLPW